MAKRYVLSDFREKRIEEASVDIELSDGSTVRVPPAECWPDKMPRGDEAQSKAVLGEADFERYIADGGTVKLLSAILADAAGASAGESDASTGS